MSQERLHLDAGDGDLLTRVGIALTLRLRHTSHAVHISVDRGTVTLRGSFPTFYDRQLAIEVTRRVAGVLRVVDELTVAPYRDGQRVSSLSTRRAASTTALRGAGTEAARRAPVASTPRPANEGHRFKSLFTNAATVLRGFFL